MKPLTHADYQVLHSAIESVVQKHAPLKQRIVRGNDKPHVKTEMRTAIMKRTGLKKRANKTGKKEDLKRYKQQRNIIFSMNVHYGYCLVIMNPLLSASSPRTMK